MARVTDWMPYGCGDYVREHDGRHIAQVEAIYWSTTAKVRWVESGYTETFALAQLVRLTWTELYEAGLLTATAPLDPAERPKPSTVVPSPKYRLKWGLP